MDETETVPPKQSFIPRILDLRNHPRWGWVLSPLAAFVATLAPNVLRLACLICAVLAAMWGLSGEKITGKYGRGKVLTGGLVAFVIVAFGLYTVAGYFDKRNTSETSIPSTTVITSKLDEISGKIDKQSTNENVGSEISKAGKGERSASQKTLPRISSPGGCVDVQRVGSVEVHHNAILGPNCGGTTLVKGNKAASVKAYNNLVVGGVGAQEPVVLDTHDNPNVDVTMHNNTVVGGGESAVTLLDVPSNPNGPKTKVVITGGIFNIHSSPPQQLSAEDKSLVDHLIEEYKFLYPQGKDADMEQWVNQALAGNGRRFRIKFTPLNETKPQ